MTFEQRLRIAMLDINRLASERTLLKGHFGLVAKRHGVKAGELIKAYKEGSA